MAETVARHLVATGLLIDEDPTLALAHAMAARRLASRIAAVREAVGLAAYHSGEWQTAIAELRTYHRMTGLQSHLAVLADCERALGRPERAIDLFRGADQAKLDQAVAIELLIVAAGARGDLGQKDAAVAMLQVRELTAESAEPWAARLRYAYADALLAVGRREEAREWFSRASDIDSDGETDAAERLLELDGVVIEGDDEDDESDDGPTGTDSSATHGDSDDEDDLDEDDDDDLDDDEDDDLDRDEDEDDDLDEDDTPDGDRADASGAGDAARAGYRDRDAADLTDDELTDDEADSLAATGDAPADQAENRPPTAGGHAPGGDEAAERR
ncbi:tetratricopeptide repeat protein [Micromonospora sp. NPDC051141]|uniref:tetratricopeptide repeat protein n=1 Tax=Micromonospora sp. NPDC051141 TaxID=3364284 RepID=UPI00379A08CD